MKRHPNGGNAVTSHLFALIIGNVLSWVDGYECNLGSIVALEPEVGDSGTINSANYPNAYPMLKGFCHIDFHICPGCILDVRFDDVDLNPCPRDYMFAVEESNQGHLAKNNGTLCDFADQCDYIIWWSKDEGLRQLGGHLTGTVITSHSSSPSPWLHFCYSDIVTQSNHVKRWKIDFMVNDQYTYRIHGSAINEDSSDRLHQGVLRSTGFPFMTNEQTAEYTYLLQGQLDSDRIILGFDDFYIDAEHSLFTIYDGSIVNRSLVHMSYSGFIHPPQFWSSSPYLLLHYTAGQTKPNTEYRQSQWGFKASYRFVNKNRLLREEKVITDCEPINLYSGGTLIQNGGPETRVYDCVWPLPCPPQHASSISLLNVTLPEGGKTRLEVKNAYHSDGKILAELSSASDLHQLHTVNVDSDSGLYVRLQGALGPEHQVSFSYTVFKPLSESTVRADKGCRVWVKWRVKEGFICRATMRCIPQRLLCDSAPHCGNMEDETTPCHLSQQDIKPSAWRNSSTCHYPNIFCGEGRCVNHAAHCRIHPAKNCWGPWNIPCKNKRKCYRIEEKCDKANQCGDNTDENDCTSEMAHSLGHVWYFFLPVVLLMLTFAGGCVVYKTRKTRNQYRAGQVVSSDNIQLHTFPGASGSVQPVAPPSYDDVIASPDTYIPANTKEETEPPPSYASVAMLQPMNNHSNGFTIPDDACPAYTESHS